MQVQGKRGKRRAVVTCSHGVYFVPNYCVSKTGKVNFLAKGIVNFLVKMRKRKFKQQTLPVSFMPGMNCNLCCCYCYQRTSSESPLLKPRFKPIANYPQPLINFITQQARKLNLDNVSVGLLGGEPLLYKEQIIHFLRELHQAITVKEVMLVTNATLLDDETLQEFINLGLREVQFSFDGFAEDHDSTRHFPTGKGSYELTFEALQSCIQQQVRCIVRVNLTSQNVSRVDFLLEHLASLGRNKDFVVNFALVENTKFYQDSNGNEDCLAQLRKSLHKAKQLGLRVALPSHTGSCLTCGDAENRRGVVLTADGYLYSCWESAGQDGMAVGDCQHGYYLNRKPNWVRCGCNNDPAISQGFILETVSVLDEYY